MGLRFEGEVRVGGMGGVGCEGSVAVDFWISSTDIHCPVMWPAALCEARKAAARAASAGLAMLRRGALFLI